MWVTGAPWWLNLHFCSPFPPGHHVGEVARRKFCSHLTFPLDLAVSVDIVMVLSPCSQLLVLGPPQSNPAILRSCDSEASHSISMVTGDFSLFQLPLTGGPPSTLGSMKQR